MEPRQPKPAAESPEVEGGEKDQSAPQPAPDTPGGMIGEGGGASNEGDREGGMLGQG